MCRKQKRIMLQLFQPYTSQRKLGIVQNRLTLAFIKEVKEEGKSDTTKKATWLSETCDVQQASSDFLSCCVPSI